MVIMFAYRVIFILKMYLKEIVDLLKNDFEEYDRIDCCGFEIECLIVFRM